MRFEFDAEVWLYQGDAGWHFLTLPVDIADEIDDYAGDSKKGFGSVPVEVTIGASTWRTSIFPSKEAESFVLPVKKPVRKAEGIDSGDTVTVTLLVLI